METISKAGRGLYGLVNNAGIGTTGTIAEMSFEEFDLSMKVNVYGPVLMIKAFQPLVIAAQGRIVNIGSVSGVLAGPGIPAYVMSKHAIEGLTDSLAAAIPGFRQHVLRWYAWIDLGPDRLCYGQVLSDGALPQSVTLQSVRRPLQRPWNNAQQRMGIAMAATRGFAPDWFVVKVQIAHNAAGVTRSYYD